MFCPPRSTPRILVGMVVSGAATVTREAAEADAVRRYTRGLALMAEGALEDAGDVFEALMTSPTITAVQNDVGGHTWSFGCLLPCSLSDSTFNPTPGCIFSFHISHEPHHVSGHTKSVGETGSDTILITSFFCEFTCGVLSEPRNIPSATRCRRSLTITLVHF